MMHHADTGVSLFCNFWTCGIAEMGALSFFNDLGAGFPLEKNNEEAPIVIIEKTSRQ